jgi:aspartate-semialdehyde dehydrogenase
MEATIQGIAEERASSMVGRQIGPYKILSLLGEGGIAPAAFPVSATCTRAAVSEGHTEAVAVSLGRRASPADVAAAFREFGSELARLALQSAPERMITVHDDPFRPQPRLDRNMNDGMTTVIGRLRAQPTNQFSFSDLFVDNLPPSTTSMGSPRVRP